MWDATRWMTDISVCVSLQIVDFDGESLRRTLPAIVKTLEGALSAGGRVKPHSSMLALARLTASHSSSKG